MTSATSTEALASILLVNNAALADGHPAVEHTCTRFSSLICALPSINDGLLGGTLPAAVQLGLTPDKGWRVDVMLRNAYAALSAEHRALVDGELIGFAQIVWDMMNGENHIANNRVVHAPCPG